MPRIYGIGSMEAYIRLPGGRSSEFYLAQIEAAHAGKTLLINLWDPGDTGALAANLQILQPTATTYQVTLQLHRQTGPAPHCGPCRLRPRTADQTNVTSVTTNTGGTSLFNGCWLTITIVLPNTYDAPHPSSDTVTRRRRLVEDPVQHERSRHQLLDGPDHLAGERQGQPGPPRPVVGDPAMGLAWCDPC